AIKSPGYGQHKEELLKDISVLTGGKIASPSTGTKITDLKFADLGSLKKIVVDSKSTTLVGNISAKGSVDEHVKELKNRLQNITLSIDEITKLRTRIAKLSSGVALIKVGGSTELEMIERKYRIEDALHATRAAAEEGIVPGGGMALFDIWLGITKDSELKEVNPGEKIVLDSCVAPIKRIVQNSGKSPDVVVNDLIRLKKENPETGYNASTDGFVNMINSGVIDPVKVTRTALKNAASVAITFLSLDAIIVND
ncbi:chaperonin GroEL, partial [Candidatus Woesearchaeota archaeon]|nr:chaperonin GroEL [Candidatus Woesearchaeota archaeon]